MELTRSDHALSQLAWVTTTMTLTAEVKNEVENEVENEIEK